MLWSSNWDHLQDLPLSLLNIRSFGGFIMLGPQLITVKDDLCILIRTYQFVFVLAYKLALECSAVHVKVASSILEMWYNYHTFLWTYCSGRPKVFPRKTLHTVPELYGDFMIPLLSD